MKIEKYISLLFLLANSFSFSQTFSFPVAGKSVNDISSAFGPRNLGQDNYPDEFYDYDFHCGIDIAATIGTNVYPVLDGVVEDWNITVASQNRFIVIKHSYNQRDIYVKYMHIIPTPSLLTKGTAVSGGSTVLGTILDHSGGDHLDIRYYYNNDYYEMSLDNGAFNPGQILSGINLTDKPIILDDYEHPITTTTSDLGVLNDNNQDHDNIWWLNYLQFGARCKRTEVDISHVEIEIHGKSISTGQYLYNIDLIHDADTWKTVYGSNFGSVNYDRRRYCGDFKLNNIITEDNGFLSYTVGIIPKRLSTTDTYHSVNFRWYLNPDKVSDWIDRFCFVYVEDWKGNLAAVSYWPIVSVVCDPCPPQPGIPGVPSINSISYIQNDNTFGSIQLNWTEVSNSPKFYKIYRCPSDRAMTNSDVVGSTNETSFIDSDPNLLPGIMYKYEVAGVNNTGEGINSASAICTFTGQLPVTISGVRDLQGNWLCQEGLTVPLGSELNVFSNTTIKIAPGKNIIALGKIIANGTETDQVLFTSSSGASPGSWGSIKLDGAGASGSVLNNITMQYGGDIQFLNNANATLQNSQIKDCTRGVYIYNSAPQILNNTIENVQTDGISCNAPGYSILLSGNTITKNPGVTGYKNYSGIVSGVNNSTLYVPHNDIRGFSYGMYFGGGTDAGLLDFAGNHPIPNGRITDCNRGIVAAWGSSAALNYYSGHNSIYGNSLYDLYAYQSGYMDEAYNYYGGGNPKKYFDATSYIASSNLLTSDPWNPGAPQSPLAFATPLMEAKSKSAPVNVSGVNGQENDEADFIKANEFEHQKNFTAAIALYKQMVKIGKKSRQCLAALARIANRTESKDLLLYFESLNNADSPYQLYSMQTLAGMYMRQGETQKSIAMYDEVISKFPDTHDAKIAWLQKFYFTLHSEKDIPAAKSLLTIILQKYSNEDEEGDIERAEFALSSSLGLSKGELKKQIAIEQLPTEYSLSQNYPNPFNPTTSISFALPQDGMTTLKIYDALGREVKTLVNEFKTTGRYTAEFDASKLSSGVYLYKLVSDKYTSVRKMLLLK